MKKTLIRLSSLCLSVIVAAMSFTACGTSKTQDAKDESTSSSATTPPAGPVSIKMMNRINAEVKVENSDYIRAIEKAANVKLEIEAPPINNYYDRLKIVMASGDYPDLVYGGIDTNYEQWASDGILLPLDDKISKYPNLMSNLPKEMWDGVKATTTGKIHGVPKANKVNRNAYLINQQWMDKLGLKVPSTIDEFYEIAKAVATRDPDANGKADTFAISPFGLWGDAWLLAAFDMQATKGIKDVDGNYKIKERFEGYYPYLTFMRKLYSEKLLDPEFFLNKIYNDHDKFLQGRIAFLNVHDGNLVNFTSKEPEALKKFTYNPPLKNKKGEIINVIYPPIWGIWSITRNAKDVNGILKFLDWGNSKEGFQLMALGVQGVHYEEYKEAQKSVRRTDAQTIKSKAELSSYTSISYALNGMVAAMGDSDEKSQRYTKDLDAYLKVTKEITLPSIKSPKLDQFGTDYPDLVKKRDEMEVQYVTGGTTLEQFKDFMNKEFLPKIDAAEKEYLDIMKKIK